MSDLTLSLVLPIKGSQEELDACLSDVGKLTKAETWELIVIDDNSPHVLSLNNQDRAAWRLVRREGESAASAARNTGAELSKGKHIVFLSSFLSYPNDYIEKVNAFIAENSFDFAQHPIVVSNENSLNHFQSFIGNQSRRVDSTGENLSIKQSLFTAAIIKRDTFIQHGGFDSNMTHYGGHEMDLIYRMDKAGLNKRIEIKDVVLKRKQVSNKTKTVSRLREYGRTGLPNLINKHPELKDVVLPLGWLWRAGSLLGLTKALEGVLSTRIEKDRRLSYGAYRLYLHLVVRNAWDVR